LTLPRVAVIMRERELSLAAGHLAHAGGAKEGRRIVECTVDAFGPGLREELMAMAAEDRRVRAELAADGSLFDGYHPRMAEVNGRNAARLAVILDRHGWPVPAMVGEDGAEAAWMVLQHAIGDPPLMRRGLELLARPGPGEVDPARLAMLEDRVRASEGRPQRHGTQYDWDEAGQLGPLPVEDPGSVDELRRSVGLGPLEENTRRIREETARAGGRPPPYWAERQRRKWEWERSVGWHD
jgi:hypothetical protein